MIRTKQPQVLDAMNRVNEIVYMDINGHDSKQLGVVKFNVSYHVLDIEYRSQIEMRPNGELNELGEPIMVSTMVNYAKPFLKNVFNREAIYRDKTYYEVLGNPSPSEFDALMVSQIEYVNGREWTGNEIQQVYYWNLKAEDLEILTQEQLDELLTPYEV